jgi:Leucine-rich repeat (LRR) protein
VELQELYLSENCISRIEGLDSLMKLQRLHLSKNQIAKIEGLDSLVNLQELDFSSNDIGTLEGLGKNVNLRFIGLSNLRIPEKLINKLGGIEKKLSGAKNPAAIVRYCQKLG